MAKPKVVKDPVVKKEFVTFSQYRAARTVILSLDWEGDVGEETNRSIDKQWNDFISAVTYGTEFKVTPLGKGLKVQKIGERKVEATKEGDVKEVEKVD